MGIICIFVYIQAFFWLNVLRLQQTAKEVPGRYYRDSSRMRDKELQTLRENTLDVLVGIQHVSPPSMGHPFSAQWYCITTIDLVQSADWSLVRDVNGMPQPHQEALGWWFCNFKEDCSKPLVYSWTGSLPLVWSLDWASHVFVLRTYPSRPV